MTASGTPERVGSLRTPDKRTLAWSEWGPVHGRPVLLVHGTPGSSHVCPDVEATHDLGVRLIVPDRPGYGDSDARPGRTLRDDADDLTLLLDHESIGAAPLVAWSSGGAFALAFAADHGDRMLAIALVAADAPPDETAAPDDEAAARRDVIRASPAAARPGMMERGRWFAADPTSIIAEDEDEGDDDAPNRDADAELRRQRADVHETLVEMFRHAARHGQDGWVDDSIALQLPWPFALGDIDRPVTVWYGARDRLASRSDSELLAAHIPGARLVVLPDDGHSLPMRHWRAILEDVLGGADGSLASG